MLCFDPKRVFLDLESYSDSDSEANSFLGFFWLYGIGTREINEEKWYTHFTRPVELCAVHGNFVLAVLEL